MMIAHSENAILNLQELDDEDEELIPCGYLSPSSSLSFSLFLSLSLSLSLVLSSLSPLFLSFSLFLPLPLSLLYLCSSSTLPLLSPLMRNHFLIL
jgi:hypothetical protein